MDSFTMDVTPRAGGTVNQMKEILVSLKATVSDAEAEEGTTSQRCLNLIHGEGEKSNMFPRAVV